MLYRIEDLDRLEFVRRALSLGFTTEAIRELMKLHEGKSKRCDDAHAIAQRHLDNVRRQLSELRRIEQALALLVAGCQPNAAIAECPVLQAFIRPSILPRLEATPPPLRLRWRRPGEHHQAVFHLNESQGHQVIDQKKYVRSGLGSAGSDFIRRSLYSYRR